MLTKIIEAIKSLFSALFGGEKSKKEIIQEKEDTSIANDPQDAADLPQDSIVVIHNEVDPVQVDDTVVDEDFDPELFDMESDVEETSTEEVVEEEETTTETIEESEDVTPTEDSSSQEEEETEEEESEEESEEVIEEEEPTHEQRYLWCLDNGHGSLSAGKRSPKFTYEGEETQFFEYEFNRDIVRRIKEALDEKGVAYYIVVPEVEIGNILKERVARANNKKSDLTKIFVSVHANAGPTAPGSDWSRESTKGIETWHYFNSKTGKKLASTFQKHLIEQTGLHNRNVRSKSTSQFYVLRKTQMVSVLTENGFFNNRKEVDLLMKDDMRQKIADAHVAAIMEIEEKGL